MTFSEAIQAMVAGQSVVRTSQMVSRRYHRIDPSNIDKDTSGRNKTRFYLRIEGAPLTLDDLFATDWRMCTESDLDREMGAYAGLGG